MRRLSLLVALTAWVWMPNSPAQQWKNAGAAAVVDFTSVTAPAPA